MNYIIISKQALQRRETLPIWKFPLTEDFHQIVSLKPNASSDSALFSESLR
jgi:hypothetical protein